MPDKIFIDIELDMSIIGAAHGESLSKEDLEDPMDGSIRIPINRKN